MKEFKLDLSKMKKVSQDNKTTTMRHPDGHSIVIAHHKLSPKMRSDLAALPTHMEEGGMVKSTMDEDLLDNKKPNKSTKLNDIDQLTSYPTESPDMTVERVGPYDSATGASAAQPTNTLPTVQSNESLTSAQQQPTMVTPTSALSMMPAQPKPEAPQSTATPATPQQPATAKQQPGSDLLATSGIATGAQNVVQGLQDEAAAQQQLLEQQAKLQQKRAEDLQKQEDFYKTNMGNLVNDYNNAKTALKQMNIDPNRYLNSMTTGQQIMSGIGIFLGGIGSGFGGSNQALDFINHQIDRDIEAQTKNLGKEQNLLTSAMQQFGNIRDASDFIRILSQDQLAAKLQAEAAKATSPQIKAQLLQKVGEIQQNIGQRMTVLNAMQVLRNSGGGGKEAQQYALNTLREFAPDKAAEVEKRFVPNIGMAQVPLEPKVREELTNRQNLQDAIQELRNFAKENSGTVLNRATVERGMAMARGVNDKYRQVNGHGVFRETDADFINGMVPGDPTKFFSSIFVDPAYKATLEASQSKLNALKHSYGLPVPAPLPESPPVKRR